jgi:hypothetical protein
MNFAAGLTAAASTKCCDTPGHSLAMFKVSACGPCMQFASARLHAHACAHCVPYHAQVPGGARQRASDGVLQEDRRAGEQLAALQRAVLYAPITTLPCMLNACSAVWHGGDAADCDAAGTRPVHEWAASGGGRPRRIL